MNLGDTLTLCKKISEICDHKAISIDEVFLLLSIHARTDDSTNIDLHQSINWYYKHCQFLEVEGDKYGIPWGKRIQYLIDLGLLEAPYGSYTKVMRNGKVVIDILKLEVTDKFKKQVLVDKKDALWELLLSEWGEFYYNPQTGESFTNRIPSSRFHKLGVQSEEDLKTLFWKHTDYGTITGIKSFFDTMYTYKEKFGANVGLTRFLLEYQDRKKVLEAAIRENEV